MDIRIVTPEGKPVEEKESVQVDPTTIEGSQPDELYQREVGRVMGLENESDFDKYQPNLKTLVDYAKSQSTDHSPENLKWIIRSLNAKLGTPPFGEDRIKFISRYTYLVQEGKKIEEEKRKFEQV
jgi:hypothetical protein